MASDNLPIPPHPMPSLDDMLADARAAYGEAIGQMMDEVLAGFVLPDQKAAIVLDVAQFTSFLMCIKVVELRGQTLLVERLTTEADDLTTSMDERKAAITASITRAAMPVPGLSFGDGEVLFNDLPLEQASSAEQLRVSTAIGMAQAPKLRVMLVRDGSLLDDEGERILADLAEQNGFQLWVEAVDASGKVGIVLEDGAVVAIDGEPAPEPEPIGAAKRRPKKQPTEERTHGAESAVDDPLPTEEKQEREQSRSILQHPEAADSLIADAPPPEPQPEPVRQPAPALGLFD